MPKGLPGMFKRRRSKPEAETVVQALSDRQPRIGLWVLSSFATVAALVAITVMVVGRDNADLMVALPLALFWGITVCVGFAVRAALINVVGSVARRKPEMPDATLERLVRMVQRERNHAVSHPHLARTLVHAA